MTTSGVTSPPAAIDQVAYDNHLRVRDEVLRMQAAIRAGRDGAAGEAAPSRYWTEELTNIDYMIEASPLIIRKLRQHAFHITNLRPYHYRDFADRQAYFERRMQALTALGGGVIQRAALPIDIFGRRPISRQLRRAEPRLGGHVKAGRAAHAHRADPAGAD